MIAGNRTVYSSAPIYGSLPTEQIYKIQLDDIAKQLNSPGAYHGYHMQVAESASDVLVDGANAVARALVVYLLLKHFKVKVKPKFFVYLVAADVLLSQTLPKRTVSGQK